ncbi:alpha-amylase [Marinobacter sp. HL-58]|uniref:alpha-amylase n=1 Tax=Marinobacter sp. HL-58 TaxID=1479237 RepID=UPI00048161CA|nr:alpha-amylase [Marinobacter sp. HL-58]KPP98987.1 MAG: alpha-amylase [Marinobacter sp. HL-58]
MNQFPKNPGLVASLVTCLSLAGCASGQFETAAPPSDNAASSTNDGQCTATRSEMTVSVGDTFAEGEWVRDFYSGEKARVENGKVRLTPAPEAEGLLLLEAAETPEQSFNWAGATIYFTVTDRFANGRTDNDRNYGRQPDGEDEIGTFHGGDFAGLTEKLDYLEELGVNAVWITPPFEQIHGWVGGGDRGDFQHYAYHGYYALDFTRPDANFGTREEFRTLVEEAHDRGIRVVMDVVMNHPGYATLQDMQTFSFGGLREGFAKHLPDQWGDWQPESWENFHAYHALIDYDHPDWANWWGKDWVRAGIGDYDSAPQASVDPVKGSLAFLPDFKTESDNAVDLPAFLRKKKNTRARQLDNATVRDYLITWLTDWVREFGIDGFRVDTAKHVEPEAWQELKSKAQQALDTYRATNPGQALPARDFWMVAEVFPHSVTRSSYFDSGFDAVINFDLQEEARAGADCLDDMEPVYNEYAKKMNSDQPFNVMSYISSHDTSLFSHTADNNPVLQKRVAAALLFTPGTSQLFYGDESGRRFGPTGSDGHQGTRSDMNWADIEDGTATPVLSHWKKLGQFRERHPAIGAGQHKRISTEPYAFSRTHGDDRVIIAFGKE